MPANSAKGWPYVLATDNVADYPVTSQALATFADAHVPFAMADGTANIVMTSGGPTTQAVVFPAGLFTVPPVVLVTRVSGNSGGKGIVYAGAITKDGCNVIAQITDASVYNGTVNVAWLALQMGAGIA